jgi:hypothetical protein
MALSSVFRSHLAPFMSRTVSFGPMTIDVRKSYRSKFQHQFEVEKARGEKMQWMIITLHPRALQMGLGHAWE